MKDIKDCYAVVQIDGKYKGSSNWNCVAYGYPTLREIPEKFKDEKVYKINKIGNFGEKKMKAGIKVRMINCAEAEKYPKKIWTTRSDSWELGDGTEVILLEGKSGGFSVKFLKEIKEAEEIA